VRSIFCASLLPARFRLGYATRVGVASVRCRLWAALAAPAGAKRWVGWVADINNDAGEPLLRQVEAAIGRESEAWVPRNLPKEAFGISEVAVIAAPDSFLSSARDASPKHLRLRKHGVHLVPGSRIIGQSQTLRRRGLQRHSGICSQVSARMQRQPYTIKLEEATPSAALTFLGQPNPS